MPWTFTLPDGRSLTYPTQDEDPGGMTFEAAHASAKRELDQSLVNTVNPNPNPAWNRRLPEPLERGFSTARRLVGGLPLLLGEGLNRVDGRDADEGGWGDSFVEAGRGLISDDTPALPSINSGVASSAQFLRDSGDKLGMGLAGLGVDVGQIINALPGTGDVRARGDVPIGDMIANPSRAWRDDISASLSPEGLQAMGGGVTPGNVALSAVESIPSFAPTIAAAIASGGVAASATEGAMAMGQIAETIDESIRDFASYDPQGFLNSEVGRAALERTGGDYSSAVELAAHNAKGAWPAVGGVATAAISRLVGQDLGAALRGSGKRVAQGIIARTLLGAGQESAEEFLQSGQEAVTANLAIAGVDPNRAPFDGALDSAIIGGLSAAPLGGALGALSGRHAPDASLGGAAPPTPSAGAVAPNPTPGAPAAPHGDPLTSPLSPPRSQIAAPTQAALPAPSAAFQDEEESDDDPDTMFAQRLQDHIDKFAVNLPDAEVPDLAEGVTREIRGVPLYSHLDDLLDDDGFLAFSKSYVENGGDLEQSEAYKTLAWIEQNGALFRNRYRKDQQPAGYGVQIIDTTPDGKRSIETFALNNPEIKSAAEAQRYAEQQLAASPTIDIDDRGDQVVPRGEIEQRGVFKPQPTGKPNPSGLSERRGGVRTPPKIRLPADVRGAEAGMRQAVLDAHQQAGSSSASISIARRALGRGEKISRRILGSLVEDGSLAPRGVIMEQPEAEQESIIVNAPQLDRRVGKPRNPGRKGLRPQPTGEKLATPRRIEMPPEALTPSEVDTRLPATNIPPLYARREALFKQSLFPLRAKAIALGVKAAGLNKDALVERIIAAETASPASATAEPAAPRKRSIMGETDAFAARRPSRAAKDTAPGLAEADAIEDTPPPSEAKKQPRTPKRTANEVREELRRLDIIEDDDARVAATQDSNLSKAELDEFVRAHPKLAGVYSGVISDLRRRKSKIRADGKTKNNEDLVREAQDEKERLRKRLHERLDQIAERAARNQPSAAVAGRAAADIIERQGGVALDGKKQPLTEPQRNTLIQLTRRAWLKQHPQAPDAPTPMAALAGDGSTADPFARKTKRYVEAQRAKAQREELPLILTTSDERRAIVRRTIAKYAPRIAKDSQTLAEAISLAEAYDAHWAERYGVELSQRELSNFRDAVMEGWYLKHPALIPPRPMEDRKVQELEDRLNEAFSSAGLNGGGVILTRAPLTVGGQLANARYNPIQRAIEISLHGVNPEGTFQDTLRTLLPWLSEEMLHAARRIGNINDMQYQALSDYIENVVFTEEDAALINFDDGSVETGVSYYDAFAPLYRVYYGLKARQYFSFRHPDAYLGDDGVLRLEDPDGQGDPEVQYAEWLRGIDRQTREDIREETMDLVREEAIGKALQVAAARTLNMHKQSQAATTPVARILLATLRKIAGMANAIARVFSKNARLRQDLIAHAERFNRSLFSGDFASSPDSASDFDGAADSATAPAIKKALKDRIKSNDFPLANFIGRDSRFAHLSPDQIKRFDRAKELKQRGVDNLSIWRYTRVAYRGNGEPSMRLDPRDVQISDRFHDWYWSGKGQRRFFYLDELIDANTLFSHVPVMKNVAVMVARGKGQSHFMTDDMPNGETKLQIKLYLDNDNYSEGDLRKTIVHEIDHVLQAIFKFIEGASPEFFTAAAKAGRDRFGAVDPYYESWGNAYIDAIENERVLGGAKPRSSSVLAPYRRGAALYFALEGEVSAREAADMLDYSDADMAAPPEFLTRKVLTANPFGAALAKIPLAIYAGASDAGKSIGTIRTAELLADHFGKQASISPAELVNLDKIVREKLADVDENGFFSALERAWNHLKQQKGFPKEATLQEWKKRLRSANVPRRPTHEETEYVLDESRINQSLDRHDLLPGYKYSADTIERIISGNVLRLRLVSDEAPVGSSITPRNTSRWTARKRENPNVKGEWRAAVYDENGALVDEFANLSLEDALGNARSHELRYSYDLSRRMRKPGITRGGVLYGHRLTNIDGKIAREDDYLLPRGVIGSEYDAAHSSRKRDPETGGYLRGVYLNVLTDQHEARIDGSDEKLDVDMPIQIQADMVQSKSYIDDGFSLAELTARLLELEEQVELHAGSVFDPTHNERLRQLTATRFAINRKGNIAPLQTTEQFVRIGISGDLYRAAANNRDGVAIPTGGTVDIAQGNTNEARRAFYDTTVHNIAKKLAREYGLEFHKGSVTYLANSETHTLLPAQRDHILSIVRQYKPMRELFLEEGLFDPATIDEDGKAQIHLREEITKDQINTIRRELNNIVGTDFTSDYTPALWAKFIRDSEALRSFLLDGATGAFPLRDGGEQQAGAWIMKFTPQSRAKALRDGFPLMAVAPKGAKTYNPLGGRFGAAINPSGTYASIPNQPGYLEDIADIEQQLANVPTYAPMGVKVADKRLKKLSLSTTPVFGGVLDAADKTGEALLRRGWSVALRSLKNLLPGPASFIEGYFPFGGVPESSALLAYRSLAQGRIGQAQDVAKTVAGAVAKSLRISTADAVRAMAGDYSGQNEIADKIEHARIILTARKASAMNAAAAALNDPELVQTLVDARRTVLDVGRALTEHHVIHRNQFMSKAGRDPNDVDSVWGGYLRRAYAEHFEDLRPAAGIRASGAHYRKMREIIPQGERLRKGEITDLPTLIYLSVEEPLRDIAIYNYFNSIMHHSENAKNSWFLPDSLVEFDGKKRTLWYVANQKDRNDKSLAAKRAELVNLGGGIGLAQKRLVMEIAILEQKSLDMEAIIQTNPQWAKKLSENEIPKGYRQIPDNPSQFGDAAGGIVMRQIYDDIMGGAKTISLDTSDPQAKVGNFYKDLNRFIKFMYTVANPPTHFRNFYSNMLMLQRSGTNIARLFPAASDLISYARTGKKSASVEAAIKYGAMKQSFTEAEIRAVEEFLQRVEREQNSANIRDWADNTLGVAAPAFNMANAGLSAIHGLLQQTGNAASALYQLGDVLFKVAKIADELDRGTPPVLAAQEARDFFFDYSAVNPWVRFARTWALAPFLSYVYFAIPKMIETTAVAPWRMAPSYLMYAALISLAASLEGFDDEETVGARKTLNEGLERRIGLAQLPERDQHNRLQYADFGYLLPEGALFQAASDASNGNVMEALSSIGFTGGPVPAWWTVSRTGYDPFRGTQIWGETDDESTKAGATGAFIARSFLPPMLNYYTPAFPWESRGGTGAEALFGSGVDSYGQPTQTREQLALRAIGVSIYPSDPNYGRTRRVLRHTAAMREVRAELNFQARNQQNYRDGVLTPDGERRINAARAKLQAHIDDLRAYLAETAAIAESESQRQAAGD